MTQYVIGKRYKVPCLFVSAGARTRWMPRGGWVPVLGNKHDDKDLGVEFLHWHIDWRFIAPMQMQEAMLCGAYTGPSARRYVLGRVITRTQVASHAPEQELDGEPELRIRTCYQVMPDFPQASNKLWHAFEESYACRKLRNGICPHRGIPLKQFEKEDGTAICPGHGLRWNLKTGVLIPHHTQGKQGKLLP